MSDPTELAPTVKMLEAIMGDLEEIIRSADLTSVIEPGLICTEILKAVSMQLSDIRKQLADKLGEQMGTRHLIVEGAGTFSRHARREGSTKCIDEHGLYRYLVDSRLVDEHTGEVVPTHEILRRAYGSVSKATGELRLTGASPSKIEALGVGIDPDDFFEKAPVVGWTLELK